MSLSPVEHLARSADTKSAIILYHGMPGTIRGDQLGLSYALTNSNYEELGDQASNPSANIFATQHLNAALAYALKNQDAHYVRLMPGSHEMHMVVLADRGEQVRQNMGGTIYQFPSDGFVHHGKIEGLTLDEWTSSTPVKIDPAKAIPVTLASAMENGVQVFFVPPDTDSDILLQIWEDRSSTFESSMLKKYLDQGFLVWENSHHGENPLVETPSIKMKENPTPPLKPAEFLRPPKV